MQKQKSAKALRTASSLGQTSTNKRADDDATMIRMYRDEKKSLREVAEVVGISHVGVMNRLKRLNVEMRGTGKRSDIDKDRLRKLMTTDATRSEIAFLLNVAPSTAGKAMIKIKEEDLAKSKSNQPA